MTEDYKNYHIDPTFIPDEKMKQRLDQANALLKQISDVTGKFTLDGIFVPLAVRRHRNGTVYGAVMAPESVGGETYPSAIHFDRHFNNVFPPFLLVLSAYITKEEKPDIEDIRQLKLGYSDKELALRATIRDSEVFAKHQK